VFESESKQLKPVWKIVKNPGQEITKNMQNVVETLTKIRKKFPGSEYARVYLKITDNNAKKLLHCCSI